MARYRVVCPACGHRTDTFERRFDADDAMKEHMKEAHPDWPEHVHFRRETLI